MSDKETRTTWQLNDLREVEGQLDLTIQFHNPKEEHERLHRILKWAREEIERLRKLVDELQDFEAALSGLRRILKA